MSDLMPNQAIPTAKRSLGATEIVASLARIDGWRLRGDGADLAIEKVFEFPDFHQTMAFVNAVAYIAHTCNHHPELQVVRTACTVRWHTHDVGGVTRDDIDAATRVDALQATRAP